MTFYISGPMTGHAEFNYPAFTKTAEEMRSAGLDVLPAHEVVHSAEDWDAKNWSGFLRRDLIAMLQQCHAIVMLDGWEKSKGANLELHVARALSMPVFVWQNGKLEAPLFQLAPDESSTQS